MKAIIYDVNGKKLCSLRDVTYSKIESNAYRIEGFCDELIVTTTQLDNVSIELIDESKIFLTLAKGYATKINGNTVVIEALLEEQ